MLSIQLQSWTVHEININVFPRYCISDNKPLW